MVKCVGKKAFTVSNKQPNTFVIAYHNIVLRCRNDDFDHYEPALLNQTASNLNTVALQTAEKNPLQ